MSDVAIIVTRADPGAQQTAERLGAVRLTPIVVPMLTLETIQDQDLVPPEQISGLVFTSANGVRTYADRDGNRTQTAWCVGPATAEAAREAGFSDIRESAGNAVDLANFIAAHSQPEAKPLLHVANEAATGSLQETLNALGFEVVFAPLYRMRPTPRIPSLLSELIGTGAPAVALFHSAKGAAAFANLMPGVDLSNWSAVCISEQASKPLKGLRFGALHLAEAPNEDGLFAALERAIATLSA
ncbi:MAG: uroporphyrinogen-III synthase [Hyphomonadaceae bacterium]|nr:uroporphyrinogen-III synthase [Hyphomonadaceae bacterium]